MMKRSQGLFVPVTITGKGLRVLGGIASMFLLLVVLSRGMYSTSPVRANNVIVSDSFSRTVSNGWGTADLGGSWTVLDHPAIWSVAPGVGSINSAAKTQNRGVLSSVAVQDVDLLAKIVLPRCTGSNTSSFKEQIPPLYAPAHGWMARPSLPPGSSIPLTVIAPSRRSVWWACDCAMKRLELPTPFR